MTAKRCPKCGKANPRFFTHCVDCGIRLPDETRKKDGLSRWIRPAAILCILALAIVFVIIPAARYFHAFETDLSGRVSNESTNQAQSVAEYPASQPVESHGLQISVGSARNGQNTYNSNRFYLISLDVRNNQSSGNIRISGSDFELTTSDGSTYSPYGIGSKVMYDLSPTQNAPAELTFIIPQGVTAKKLRYTLPATSSTANDQAVVVFDL